MALGTVPMTTIKEHSIGERDLWAREGASGRPVGFKTGHADYKLKSDEIDMGALQIKNPDGKPCALVLQALDVPHKIRFNTYPIEKICTLSE